MPMIFANVIQDAFGPLIKVFEAILVFIHAHITGGSWGLAIIGLTIVVRAALVPLTLKQFSSMSKLQALGPELKELQKRYKDDKPRLNEEMMKFYKENEVNPFGSCLPLVLQLPVFLSLFYMLRLDLKKHICGAALNAHHIVTESAISKASCGQVDPHSGKFLFIPDVTAKATGVVLGVLIAMYIASQLVSGLLTTATVDRNQRLMMLGLPFVFAIFIQGFPAGLILYWITTNLWTVGQQYIVRKRAGPVVAVRSATSGGGGKQPALPGPDKPPPQGLLARLTATRDAARSAVTGVSRAEPVTKNGKAASSRAAPRASKPATSKAKPTARTSRGGTAKASGSPDADAVVKPAAGKPRRTAAAKQAPAKGSPERASGEGDAAAKPANARSAKREPGGSGGDGAPSAGPRRAPPPPPPRKKKKRSGRRR
jgi:YidC/Oxa1 family membrane protein insertase